MKKLFGLFFFISLGFSLLWGAHVGKVDFKPQQTSDWNWASGIQSVIPDSFFAAEIKNGNLRLRLLQKAPIASMEHHRYTQYYKGLEVLGGEIIQHYRNGKLVGVNGEYYLITNLDIIPAISKEKAVESFRADLDRPYSVERAQESKLLIYPIKDDDYRLAFKIVLEEGIGYSMTGIIDAKTEEVLLKYSNILSDKYTVGLRGSGEMS